MSVTVHASPVVFWLQSTSPWKCQHLLSGCTTQWLAPEPTGAWPVTAGTGRGLSRKRVPRTEELGDGGTRGAAGDGCERLREVGRGGRRRAGTGRRWGALSPGSPAFAAPAEVPCSPAPLASPQGSPPTKAEVLLVVPSSRGMKVRRREAAERKVVTGKTQPATAFSFSLTYPGPRASCRASGRVQSPKPSGEPCPGSGKLCLVGRMVSLLGEFPDFSE